MTTDNIIFIGFIVFTIYLLYTTISVIRLRRLKRKWLEDQAITGASEREASPTTDVKGIQNEKGRGGGVVSSSHRVKKKEAAEPASPLEKYNKYEEKLSMLESKMTELETDDLETDDLSILQTESEEVGEKEEAPLTKSSSTRSTEIETNAVKKKRAATHRHVPEQVSSSRETDLQERRRRVKERSEPTKIHKAKPERSARQHPANSRERYKKDVKKRERMGEQKTEPTSASADGVLIRIKNETEKFRFGETFFITEKGAPHKTLDVFGQLCNSLSGICYSKENMDDLCNTSSLVRSASENITFRWFTEDSSQSKSRGGKYNISFGDIDAIENKLLNELQDGICIYIEAEAFLQTRMKSSPEEIKNFVKELTKEIAQTRSILMIFQTVTPQMDDISKELYNETIKLMASKNIWSL